MTAHAMSRREALHTAALSTGAVLAYLSHPEFVFAGQAWVGRFHNGGKPGPGIPRFPAAGDVAIEEARAFEVLRQPSYLGLESLAEGIERFAPAMASPVLGRAVPGAVAPLDAVGNPRAPAATIGALEPVRP